MPSRPGNLSVADTMGTPLPEVRFSDRVENYARYRPGYPAEVWDWLLRETGLSGGSVVADIGAGTGISAKALLCRGCTVFAVEPNAPMRSAAERMLGGQPGFHAVDGTAEATTLSTASVDLVLAAQAFHWFRPEPTRAEFSRILKPNGWVALVWNVRRVDSTPFLRDYEGLLLEYATDYQKVRHENVGDGELERFFHHGRYRTFSMPHVQEFDLEGLRGRLLSSSYAPAPGTPGHDAMIEHLSSIFEQHQADGRVAFEYDCVIHVGR